MSEDRTAEGNGANHDTRRGFATRAVHGQPMPVPAEHPVSTPIYESSTFAFTSADEYSQALQAPGHGYSYSRYSNPTTAALEATVADLEGGTKALATGSGMGAISSTLLALLKEGDHLVLQRSLYGGTYSLVTDLAPRFGVESSFVNPADLDEVRATMGPRTKALYVETIANPTMEVADIPALAEIAHEAGVPLVVDNTIASPYLCRPLQMGADVAIHSATKYLGGHSDVIAGVAVFADPELHNGAWRAMIDLGPSIDPFAAWLVLRGVKTLPVRMRQHSQTAGEVARFLEQHPKVEKVFWPGLPSNPTYDVARRVLDGFGGMLSFDIIGGREAGRRFIEGTRVAALAASLGGVETLVSHPASTTHRQLSPEALHEAGIGEGLIRVSIGLEDAEDIIADFEQALERA